MIPFDEAMEYHVNDVSWSLQTIKLHSLLTLGKYTLTLGKYTLPAHKMFQVIYSSENYTISTKVKLRYLAKYMSCDAEILFDCLQENP